MVITLEPELDLSSSRWTREPPTKMFPLGFAILFAFAKTSLLSLSEQRPISRYNEINIITVNSSELFSLSQERKSEDRCRNLPSQEGPPVLRDFF